MYTCVDVQEECDISKQVITKRVKHERKDHDYIEDPNTVVGLNSSSTNEVCV